MKIKSYIYIYFLFLLILSQSCNSYQYIYDTSSRERQQKLQKSWSGNVLSDLFLTMGSAIFFATTGIYFEYLPDGQNFKRLKLENPTQDTMFVNMVTDISWDNEDYCDFMDIRIPPNEKCRVLVPLGANYNVYFGNTTDPENDEMIGINTSELRKITLTQGLTNSGKPDE